eukprot:SAG31_NODE_11351_length_1040_cov_0.924548_2_plen_250_part_00
MRFRFTDPVSIGLAVTVAAARLVQRLVSGQASDADGAVAASDDGYGLPISYPPPQKDVDEPSWVGTPLLCPPPHGYRCHIPHRPYPRFGLERTKERRVQRDVALHVAGATQHGSKRAQMVRVRDYKTVVASGRRAGRRDEEARGSFCLGVAHELADEANGGEAASAYKQALQLAHKIGDTTTECLAANALGVLLMQPTSEKLAELQGMEPAAARAAAFHRHHLKIAIEVIRLSVSNIAQPCAQHRPLAQ